MEKNLSQEEKKNTTNSYLELMSKTYLLKGILIIALIIFLGIGIIYIGVSSYYKADLLMNSCELCYYNNKENPSVSCLSKFYEPTNNNIDNSILLNKSSFKFLNSSD